MRLSVNVAADKMPPLASKKAPLGVPKYAIYRAYVAPSEKPLATSRSFQKLWRSLKRTLRDRIKEARKAVGGELWVEVYAADSERELSSPRRDQDIFEAREALLRVKVRYGEPAVVGLLDRVLPRARRGRPEGLDPEEAPKMRRVLRRIVAGTGVKEAVEAEIGRKVENYEWPHPLYKKLQRYYEAAYDVWRLTGTPDLASRQPVSAGVKAEFWARLKMELPRDSEIAAKAVELHYKAITSGERKDQVEIESAGGPPPPKPPWVK